MSSKVQLTSTSLDQSSVNGTPAESARRHREEEDNGKSEATPFFYARSIVDKPCATCSCFCGTLVFFLLILVGLLGAGVEVIRFSSDVPFYYYHSTAYKRETALISAYDAANIRLDGDLREREQLESDYELKIIYELEDGETVFTPEILAGIREMEEKIVAVEEYVKFCALNYEFDAVNPICVRHDSPVNYFDTEWWLPVLDPPPQPTVPSAFNAELLVNQSKVGASTRDNYYAFADPQDPGASGTVILTQDNIDTMVQYWAGYCSSAENCPAAANGDSSPYAVSIDGNNATANNQLIPFVDTEFSIQGSEVVTSARAVRSVFYFGRPQLDEDTNELYELDTEGINDQTDELGEFLYDEVESILEDGVEGVNVFWAGDANGMKEVYTTIVLNQGVLLLIPSVIFIVIYLIFQLRSWWLGGAGLVMILANFPPSLIFYRVLSGYSYFGTLNALSIFLVLGIGADDIFLFINTWKQIHAAEPDLSILQQLLIALGRGGKAMAVTSLTTAISFLMNATSAFPAVQSFGIFSAILILINFTTVITLYPAVTMVYEYHMNNNDSMQKNCCKATCHCCKEEKGYTRAAGATNASGHAESEGLAKFFEHKFYPFVHKFRLPLLIIFAGILALYGAVGSQLEPDADAPELLPDSDQYVEVRDKITDYFSHSDTTDLITLKIPFGILGADRDDCDGDKCDPTIDTDYGSPIWDENVQDISNEYAQKWFLDFCDAITNADDATSTRMVYEADASVPAPVMCPLESMKTWCSQGTGRCAQTHPSLGTDEYIVDAADFGDTILAFLSDEIPTTNADIFSGGTTNYDVWSEQIRGQYSTDGNESPILRYLSVEVLLSARNELKYEKGIDLFNDWGAFLESWVELAGTDEYLGAASAVSSAFITDGGAFHWFYLQEQIILEAFQGIILSLFCAFLILCIATSNWLVSALATFTITAMVGGVVTFTVANGWKLGVLEAILFVMVVGFSVDYTVHLSDAYFEAESPKRTDRVREMLLDMGPSVLSGAISTLGTTLPLLFAYFLFFFKFGTVIFFIIAQSLIFSLFFYSAMLDVLGPEEREWGKNIKPGLHVAVQKDGSRESGVAGDGNGQEKEEHVEYGKVINVDGEMCTVTLENKLVSQLTIPTSSCRGRYEAGHMRWVDQCCAGVVSLLNRCHCKKKGSTATVSAA